MKISYLTLVSLLLLISCVISGEADKDENKLPISSGSAKKVKLRCSGYEKVRKIGSACREMCEHRKDPDKCPKDTVVGKKCYCLIGFYRGPWGKCVPEDQCDRVIEEEEERRKKFPSNVKRDVGEVVPAEPEESASTQEPQKDSQEKDNGKDGGKDGEKDDEKDHPEGIVQGGPKELPREDLEELGVTVDDHSSQKNDEKKDSGGIVQGGPKELPREDLEELGVDIDKDLTTQKYPSGSPSNQNNDESEPRDEEPMYPEDEDCGPNEKFTKCGHKCRETLDYVHHKTTCPRMCELGCFCKKGFFRDGFNNCNAMAEKFIKDMIGGVTKKAKPVRCIRDNEIYDDCGDRCFELYANRDNYTECKPYECVRGCYCLVGYLRNEEGVCIPAHRAKLEEDNDEAEDQSEGESEDYFEHGSDQENKDKHPDRHRARPKGNDDRSDRSRRRPNGEYDRSDIPRRRPNSGYDRRDIPRRRPNRGHGMGSPRRRHPNMSDKCPPNEVFSECGNRCMEASNGIEDTSNCDINWCDVGCFCQPGFQRNKGNCLPTLRLLEPPFRPSHSQRQVPRRPKNRCPPEELYSDCGNRCMEAMDNYMNPGNCDPRICDTGCFCKPGLYRRINGFCADVQRNRRLSLRWRKKPRHTSHECPPDEGFSDCGNRCMESLENRLSGVICNPNRCDIGCFCLPDLFRIRDGQCLPLPTIDRPRLGPPIPDPPRLEPPRLGPPRLEPPIPDPPIHDEPIPIPTCQINEEHLECGNDCGNTCSDYLSGNEPSCPMNCWPGCFCRRGLLRDPNERCVLPKDCVAGQRIGHRPSFSEPRPDIE